MFVSVFPISKNFWVQSQPDLESHGIFRNKDYPSYPPSPHKKAKKHLKQREFWLTIWCSDCGPIEIG